MVFRLQTLSWQLILVANVHAAPPNAHQASEAAGENTSAFGEAGRAAVLIGDVESLVDLPKAEEAGAAKKEEADEKASGEAGKDLDGSGLDAAKDKEKPWFNRSEKLMGEITKHQTWYTSMKASLEEQRDKLASTLLDLPQDSPVTVLCAERRLVQSRLRALKLILMEGAGESVLSRGWGLVSRECQTFVMYANVGSKIVAPKLSSCSELVCVSLGKASRGLTECNLWKLLQC